jgi:lysophospholipase L1-like esterase
MIFNDVIELFQKSEHFRIVGFGASNTERYMPCMHWLDVLEVGLRKRFGRKFQVIDSGVSGNNTQEALERFDRDVAFFQPAAVIVTLGGNDCDQRPEKHVAEPEYRKNMEEIANRIKAIGAIPIFQTYYKMDLEAMDKNLVLDFVHNMEIVRDLAKKNHWNLVDHYKVFDSLDPLVHRYKLMLNPMHTNEAGNLLMGVELLRHFDIDPTTIVHCEKLLPAVALLKSLNIKNS